MLEQLEQLLNAIEGNIENTEDGTPFLKLQRISKEVEAAKELVKENKNQISVSLMVDPKDADVTNDNSGLHKTLGLGSAEGGLHFDVISERKDKDHWLLERFIGKPLRIEISTIKSAKRKPIKIVDVTPTDQLRTLITVENLKAAGFDPKLANTDPREGDEQYSVEIGNAYFYFYTTFGRRTNHDVKLTNDEFGLNFRTIEKAQEYVKNPYVTLDDWLDEDSKVREAAKGYICSNRSMPEYEGEKLLKEGGWDIKVLWIDDQKYLFNRLAVPQKMALEMVAMGFVVDTDFECWKHRNTFHWYQPRVGFGPPVFDPKLDEDAMIEVFNRFKAAEKFPQKLYTTPDDHIFTDYDLAIKNVEHGRCNIKGDPKQHVKTWEFPQWLKYF